MRGSGWEDKVAGGTRGVGFAFKIVLLTVEVESSSLNKSCRLALAWNPISCINNVPSIIVSLAKSVSIHLSWISGNHGLAIARAKSSNCLMDEKMP